ncbi:MAG: hypothetical protein J0G30_08280 [Actinomycetales bacterium]|nr:hypothetical protein [Actinomycetales bacterium]
MSLLFVFDMDDVLYDYDYRVRMDALSRRTGLPFAELRERWWNREGEWRAEAGAYRDGASYLAAVNAALGSDLDVEEWLAIRRSGMTPWPDSIACVARAAELGATSLLTNNGALVDEHLPELAPELRPWIADADLRASSRYGARKPDRAVFAALLASYEADPAEVFFADDLPENVAGAAALGITAHRFTDADALRAAIEEFATARRD